MEMLLAWMIIGTIFLAALLIAGGIVHAMRWIVSGFRGKDDKARRSSRGRI